jgi:hypothetical protein
MHLFHVAVAAHQEYRKTFNPSESGPSPAQKNIKLAKVPLGSLIDETQIDLISPIVQLAHPVS